MGVIVTLYLISCNVYNSVEAPKSRGFSYIELWIIGTQIPILLSLTEYALILYWKKTVENSPKVGTQSMNPNHSRLDLDERIKILDLITLAISFVYFVLFALYYWIGNPLKYLAHI